MKITVLSQQSLLDIAIQTAGSIEEAFELAVANNKSVTDDLITGDSLSLSEGRFKNKVITEYYKNRDILPATGLTLDQIGYDGINYMGIEYDFIVD